MSTPEAFALQGALKQWSALCDRLEQGSALCERLEQGSWAQQHWTELCHMWNKIAWARVGWRP